MVVGSAVMLGFSVTRRIRPTTSASFRHCMVDLLFVELKDIRLIYPTHQTTRQLSQTCVQKQRHKKRQLNQ